MDVDSELGVGSTFWFELDMERAPSVASDSRTIVAGSTAILLALDPAISRVLRQRLAAMAVLATDAPDAQAALAALGQARKERRPVVFVGEKSLGMVKEITAEQQAGAAGPSFVFAGEVEQSGGDRRRQDCVTAVARPFEEREVSAALKIALSAGAFGQSTLGELASARRRSLTVLVADDNHTNQKVIAKILERGGHRSKVVDNGEQAVDALLAGGVDIVFMDVNMPVMNGIEATKLYRFAALGRPRVPIVALTADATPEAKARCEEAGMDGCVTKPIEASELFRIIDKLVPESAEEAAAADGEPAFLGETVTDISAHPRFRAETRAIDAATVAQLEELGGKTFVKDLAREFLEEGAKIVAEIDQSVADADYAYFRDRAHAMRSGAANIGALRLYELCLSLRAAGDAEFAAVGAQKAAEIRDEFAKVRRELNEYCAEQGGAAASPAEGQPAGGRPVSASVSPLPIAARSSGGSAPR
jgi:two-component system sensor histidine kinase RpfC